MNREDTQHEKLPVVTGSLSFLLLGGVVAQAPAY
jgi:hypothetical protein